VAAIKSSMKLEGFKELEDALLELPKSTQGGVLKRAVAGPAADFADHAASLAPKDRGVLATQIKVSKPKIINPGTAAFAAAMREGSTRAEAAQAARAANRAAGGKGKSVVTHVGPTKKAFHGSLQEFGTRHHPPQPFMRPTWDAFQGRMLTSIRDTLAQEIEKARKRIAKRAERLAAKMKAGG